MTTRRRINRPQTLRPRTRDELQLRRRAEAEERAEAEAVKQAEAEQEAASQEQERLRLDLEAIRPFTAEDGSVDIVAALEALPREQLERLFTAEDLERGQTARVQIQQRETDLEAIAPFRTEGNTIDLAKALREGGEDIEPTLLRLGLPQERIDEARTLASDLATIEPFLEDGRVRITPQLLQRVPADVLERLGLPTQLPPERQRFGPNVPVNQVNWARREFGAAQDAALRFTAPNYLELGLQEILRRSQQNIALYWEEFGLDVAGHLTLYNVNEPKMVRRLNRLRQRKARDFRNQIENNGLSSEEAQRVVDAFWDPQIADAQNDLDRIRAGRREFLQGVGELRGQLQETIDDTYEAIPQIVTGGPRPDLLDDFPPPPPLIAAPNVNLPVAQLTIEEIRTIGATPIRADRQIEVVQDGQTVGVATGTGAAEAALEQGFAIREGALLSDVEQQRLAVQLGLPTDATREEIISRIEQERSRLAVSLGLPANAPVGSIRATLARRPVIIEQEDQPEVTTDQTGFNQELEFERREALRDFEAEQRFGADAQLRNAVIRDLERRGLITPDGQILLAEAAAQDLAPELRALGFTNEQIEGALQEEFQAQVGVQRSARQLIIDPGQQLARDQLERRGLLDNEGNVLIPVSPNSEEVALISQATGLSRRAIISPGLNIIQQERIISGSADPVSVLPSPAAARALSLDDRAITQIEEIGRVFQGQVFDPRTGAFGQPVFDARGNLQGVRQDNGITIEPGVSDVPWGSAIVAQRGITRATEPLTLLQESTSEAILSGPNDPRLQRIVERVDAGEITETEARQQLARAFRERPLRQQIPALIATDPFIISAAPGIVTAGARLTGRIAARAIPQADASILVSPLPGQSIFSNPTLARAISQMPVAEQIRIFRNLSNLDRAALQSSLRIVRRGTGPTPIPLRQPQATFTRPAEPGLSSETLTFIRGLPPAERAAFINRALSPLQRQQATALLEGGGVAPQVGTEVPVIGQPLPRIGPNRIIDIRDAPIPERVALVRLLEEEGFQIGQITEFAPGAPRPTQTFRPGRPDRPDQRDIPFFQDVAAVGTPIAIQTDQGFISLIQPGEPTVSPIVPIPPARPEDAPIILPGTTAPQIGDSVTQPTGTVEAPEAPTETDFPEIIAEPDDLFDPFDPSTWPVLEPSEPPTTDPIEVPLEVTQPQPDFDPREFERPRVDAPQPPIIEEPEIVEVEPATTITPETELGQIDFPDATTRLRPLEAPGISRREVSTPDPIIDVDESARPATREEIERSLGNLNDLLTSERVLTDEQIREAEQTITNLYQLPLTEQQFDLLQQLEQQVRIEQQLQRLEQTASAQQLLTNEQIANAEQTITSLLTAPLTGEQLNNLRSLSTEIGRQVQQQRLFQLSRQLQTRPQPRTGSATQLTRPVRPVTPRIAPTTVVQPRSPDIQGRARPGPVRPRVPVIRPQPTTPDSTSRLRRGPDIPTAPSELERDDQGQLNIRVVGVQRGVVGDTRVDLVTGEVETVEDIERVPERRTSESFTVLQRGPGQASVARVNWGRFWLFIGPTGIRSFIPKEQIQDNEVPREVLEPNFDQMEPRRTRSNVRARRMR